MHVVGAASPFAAARAELLADVSIEATPHQVERSIAGLARHVPGAEVYVTALPGAHAELSVDAIRRLAAAGLRPVPHIAARGIAGPAALDDRLGRYVEAGADAILLVAGDLSRPAGRFASTLDVMATGLLERHGVRRVGVAGHPQGHPIADAAALEAALRAKAAYAATTDAEMWLVTQFAFEPSPVLAWHAGLVAQELALPVRVGLPGPAKPRTLLAYAMRCGVGVSSRLLARRPDALRLFGRWAPDDLLEALAAHRAEQPRSQLGALHLFPFGGIDASLEWLERHRLAAGMASAEVS